MTEIKWEKVEAGSYRSTCGEYTVNHVVPTKFGLQPFWILECKNLGYNYLSLTRKEATAELLKQLDRDRKRDLRYAAIQQTFKSKKRRSIHQVERSLQELGFGRPCTSETLKCTRMGIEIFFT